MSDTSSAVCFGFWWGFVAGWGLMYVAARYGIIGGLVAVP